jgi:hypothetical protein
MAITSLVGSPAHIMELHERVLRKNENPVAAEKYFGISIIRFTDANGKRETMFGDELNQVHRLFFQKFFRWVCLVPDSDIRLKIVPFLESLRGALRDQETENFYRAARSAVQIDITWRAAWGERTNNRTS